MSVVLETEGKIGLIGKATTCVYIVVFMVLYDIFIEEGIIFFYISGGKESVNMYLIHDVVQKLATFV